MVFEPKKQLFFHFDGSFGVIYSVRWSPKQREKVFFFTTRRPENSETVRLFKVPHPKCADPLQEVLRFGSIDSRVLVYGRTPFKMALREFSRVELSVGAFSMLPNDRPKFDLCSSPRS